MRSSAAAAIGLGALGALGGCAIIDPSQPIGVITDDLTELDAINLEEAARCWELEFGVDFRLGADADGADQLVEAYYDDQTCLNVTPARVQGTWPVSIAICPPAYWGPELGVNFDMRAFRIFSHELGHVLNIIGHPDDQLGVLSSGGFEGTPMFTPIDRAAFANANPGFVIQRACEAVIRWHRTDISGAGTCLCEGRSFRETEWGDDRL